MKLSICSSALINRKSNHDRISFRLSPQHYWMTGYGDFLLIKLSSIILIKFLKNDINLLLQTSENDQIEKRPSLINSKSNHDSINFRYKSHHSKTDCSDFSLIKCSIILIKFLKNYNNLLLKPLQTSGNDQIIITYFQLYILN